MSVPRIIPLDMIPPKQETAKEKEIETARVQNTDPTKCSICGNMLVGAVANGIPALVCLEHQIVMPRKD